MPSTSKTRFDLVPFTAVGQIADVLEFGAQKYSANNWCRGTEWSRYYAALCRHVFAWWQGEDLDPETGFSHLAHAGCCLLFLMEYQRNGWGTDDRFKGPDGETFTKHDGRALEEAAAQGNLQLELFDEFSVNWNAVGTIPAGIAASEQQGQCCFVGPDGEARCRPASPRAINDDDDGLT